MVHSLPYAVLDKEVGETPLQAIQRFRREHPLCQDVPASYAGRLDPMASGKLLILLGEECKRQDAYTGLDKEYEVEVLLDIGSDTGDVLGIVSPSAVTTTPSLQKIQQILRAECGTHERAYPVYSSKTVHGKPLFLHSLEGSIKDIQIPTHAETIYRLKLEGVDVLSHTALAKRVESKLALTPISTEPSKELGADFRIKDVLTSWSRISEERTYTVLKLRVVCGTGAYMRSLAERIGAALGTKALALSIHRTKIGAYLSLGPIGWFWREYR